MKKITETRYCEVCGVSSNIKKVVFNSATNMCLCEKHKEQFKKFGEFKDSNSRGVFDPNEIREFDTYCEIDTYDQFGNITETFTLDLDDKAKLGDYKWRTVYKNQKPYLFTGNQKSEKIYFHRLVMGTPELQVDHIDGNTLNNCKSNLRVVTLQENMKNLKKKSNNTSGIRGVSYNSRNKTWKSDFTFEKTRVYLKEYKSFEEAVYQRYLLELLLLKEFRNEANDSVYFESINKLSNEQKEVIKEYVLSKINMLKNRVEKI